MKTNAKTKLFSFVLHKFCALLLNFVVSVAEEDRSCTVYLSSSPLHISRPSTGSTSSSQSNVGLHSCGTRSQPWLLEAPSGQRINISLFNFTPFAASTAAVTANNQSQEAAHASIFTSSSSSSGRSCPHQRQLGYLIDKSAVSRNVSICGSDGTGGQRLSNVYMSTSNIIELVLAPNGGNAGTFNFLLSIEGKKATSLMMSSL